MRLSVHTIPREPLFCRMLMDPVGKKAFAVHFTKVLSLIVGSETAIPMIPEVCLRALGIFLYTVLLHRPYS